MAQFPVGCDSIPGLRCWSEKTDDIRLKETWSRRMENLQMLILIHEPLSSSSSTDPSTYVEVEVRGRGEHPPTSITEDQSAQFVSQTLLLSVDLDRCSVK
ncbi:unnamed protein product [Pleuronectes platessa]|uniref:Uncharacterized protein n=1 Tax=Pleuronectes platessa TaxID=8262 RepID=A0A9N7UNF4_PLEPL|nr:unnamed protein product [Pleuronectes platessa]